MISMIDAIMIIVKMFFGVFCYFDGGLFALQFLMSLCKPLKSLLK